MASGKWEKDIDNVLLEFGVTKESMQEDAAEKLESQRRTSRSGNGLPTRTAILRNTKCGAMEWHYRVSYM